MTAKAEAALYQLEFCWIGAKHLCPSASSAVLRGFQGLGGFSSSSASFCFFDLPWPWLC